MEKPAAYAFPTLRLQHARTTFGSSVARRAKTKRIVALAFIAFIASFAFSNAHAQVRRRFEPTDLQLQPVGTLEIDSQISYTQGDSAGRVIVPDLEVSLGLSSNVDLEIDTAYAIEGKSQQRFSFDHPAPDNLWLSSKLAIAEWRNVEARTAWALGAQLGPKVPLAKGSRGVGYELLTLIGRDIDRTHLVLNIGGYVDPSPDGTRKRTTAIEGGIDLDLDLDDVDRWSILAELGVVEFLSGDPLQAHVTAGFQYSVSKYLDLSLIGLLGLTPAGDQEGVLIGVTPRFAIWN